MKNKLAPYAWQAGVLFDNIVSSELIPAKTLIGARRKARKYALTMHGELRVYRLFRLIQMPSGNNFYWQVLEGVRENNKWIEIIEEREEEYI